MLRYAVAVDVMRAQADQLKHALLCEWQQLYSAAIVQVLVVFLRRLDPQPQPVPSSLSTAYRLWHQAHCQHRTHFGALPDVSQVMLEQLVTVFRVAVIHAHNLASNGERMLYNIAYRSDAECYMWISNSTQIV